MNVPEEATSREDGLAPRYTVKVASRLTGIPPVTLRAWERRYGLPSPARESQGYRLYSEDDLRVLKWLKTETEAGHSISRAAQRLQELRSVGRDPTRGSLSTFDRPASVNNLAADLVEAFKALDDGTAYKLLATSFSLYPVDRVLLEVIKPALTELGEAWHRGEVTIAAEHMASQLARQQISSLMAAHAVPNRAGVIVAAAAPGEQHDIGLLMISALLRIRGWDVKYLGPNLGMERLNETLATLKPRLVLFTATSAEPAARLQAALPEVLSRLPNPPGIVFGGQAFQRTPELRAPFAIYLDESETNIVQAIESLMVPSPVQLRREPAAGNVNAL